MQCIIIGEFICEHGVCMEKPGLMKSRMSAFFGILDWNV